MNQVFVVYYDESYMGVGERGASQRKIEGVFDSAEKARERVRKLESMAHVGSKVKGIMIARSKSLVTRFAFDIHSNTAT